MLPEPGEAGLPLGGIDVRDIVRPCSAGAHARLGDTGARCDRSIRRLPAVSAQRLTEYTLSGQGGHKGHRQRGDRDLGEGLVSDEAGVERTDRGAASRQSRDLRAPGQSQRRQDLPHRRPHRLQHHRQVSCRLRRDAEPRRLRLCGAAARHEWLRRFVDQCQPRHHRGARELEGKRSRPDPEARPHDPPASRGARPVEQGADPRSATFRPACEAG